MRGRRRAGLREGVAAASGGACWPEGVRLGSSAPGWADENDIYWRICQCLRQCYCHNSQRQRLRRDNYFCSGRIHSSSLARGWRHGRVLCGHCLGCIFDDSCFVRQYVVHWCRRCNVSIHPFYGVPHGKPYGTHWRCADHAAYDCGQRHGSRRCSWLLHRAHCFCRAARRVDQHAGAGCPAVGGDGFLKSISCGHLLDVFEATAKHTRTVFGDFFWSPAVPSTEAQRRRLVRTTATPFCVSSSDAYLVTTFQLPRCRCCRQILNSSPRAPCADGVCTAGCRMPPNACHAFCCR